MADRAGAAGTGLDFDSRPEPTGGIRRFIPLEVVRLGTSGCVSRLRLLDDSLDIFELAGATRLEPRRDVRLRPCRR